MSMKRARIPFRLKLFLFGGLLSVLPVSLLGKTLLDASRDEIKTLTREVQLSVAEDIAGSVARDLRSAQDDLDRVARTLLDTRLPEDESIRVALDIVASSEVLDHAGVYDDAGAMLDVIREETLSRHPLPATLGVQTRRCAVERGVCTGATIDDGETVRALIVVPMRSQGQVRGFAASQVSMAPVQGRVDELADMRFEGVPDAIFIVDERNRTFVHSDPRAAAAIGRAPAIPMLRSLRGGSLDGRGRASGEYTLDGVARLGSIVGVPGRPWTVVVQMPEARAYATLYRMERVIIATAIVVAIVALVIALALARRITKPIELLASFAVDLSNRRFDRRVALKTQDELSLLGEAMSAAAEDLAASEKQLAHEAAIRSDLGRYLPGELVEKVVRREQDMGLGGVRREISVLFADVVAFTPLTEELEADRVVALLNELFTILTEIVFKHGGTIDKFIGDCVMGVWGAPTRVPDHAARALAAAEDMIAWLETSNEGWKAKYGVTIKLAIGVNSGEAIVGNVGSLTRMEYTAIGDVVNVAARLESIARPQQILVTETTRALAGDAFSFVDRGERVLPGRVHPVRVFEVVS
jgi:adenylate cyclase